MVKHGFPLDGCTFDWDNAASFTPAEQREMERLLLQEYDIEADYFSQKYKIPIIGKKSAEERQTSQQQANDGKSKKSNVGDKGAQKLVNDFFL